MSNCGGGREAEPEALPCSSPATNLEHSFPQTMMRRDTKLPSWGTFSVRRLQGTHRAVLQLQLCHPRVDHANLIR
jgi:hypothetical protein